MSNMSKIKDGWHMIKGYRVYVKDGRVLRGVSSQDWQQRATWPYRAGRSCWTNVSGITVDAFRSGVRRGTITMM